MSASYCFVLHGRCIAPRVRDSIFAEHQRPQVAAFMECVDFMQPRWPSRIVMLEQRKILMDAESDGCIQLAGGFLILAEKELSAFIRAVDKLFGAEQARQSALDWIEELGRMDWPSGESIPDWRRATVGASARLDALSRPYRHVSEEIRHMSAIASTPIDAEAKDAPTSGRLFFLDFSAGRILSANPDGSDLKTILNEGRKLPDGLALDVAAGHIYWTNMGDPGRNDGSIMRSDLNGNNMITIVPPGGTFMLKKIQLEKRSGKLYWSDREGMRVMRANLDGSEIETLVDTSLGDSRPGSDPRKWCVGIAVDTDGGKFYWTQKGDHHAGLGRILRANIEVPQGQSAESRRDIELLYDNLPEPIDLDLDPVHRTLYWTDRGDPPRGNTVNRTLMDDEAENRKEPEILFTHLMEGIGLALDLKGARMFITDFGGSVYSANLDGSNRKTLLFAEGNLSGIAYAEMPSADRGETSRATEAPEETNMEDNTLVKSSFSATIHAPIEDVDIPTWCFGLSESEYQSCSPAHVSAGATTAPDGRRMSINVEVLGGSPMVQHYVEEIAEPHHLRLVSRSDIFTPTGRIKVGVIWDLSVKKIDGNTCEFTNEVHSSFTPELLDSLAKQGIPQEAFQSARRPISEAHNRQETPLFAKSIERHALRNGSSARVASAA